MRFVISIGVVLAVAFAALGLPAGWALLVSLAAHDRAAVLNIALGCAGGAAVGVFGRRVPGLRFLDTLCHELSHAIWAFLVGGSVDSLQASANAGGHTQSVVPRRFGGVRTFLMTIAPYWFCPLTPLGIVLLLAVEPLRGDAVPVASAIFGVLIVQPLLQWRTGQPDLRAYRIVAPVVTAGWLLAGVFTLGMTALVSGGSHGFHVVYVASCRTVGVRDPEHLVRRAGASVVRLSHPAWLSIVRAASSTVANDEGTKSGSRDGATATRRTK